MSVDISDPVLKALLSIFDGASDAIEVTDTCQRIVYVNPAFEMCTGYSLAEAVGRTTAELCGRLEDAHIYKQIQQTVANGATWCGQLMIHGQDSSASLQNITISPCLNLVGQLTHCVTIWRSFIPHQQKIEAQRMEQALHESEERFMGAFKAAVVGMVIVSIDGRFLAVNPALCALICYSEAELLGRNFSEITHEDDLGEDLSYVRRLLAGEIDSFQLEKRYIHKQGHPIWVHLSVSLVRNSEGKPMHFVAMMEDIHSRRLAEASIQQLNIELQQRAEALAESEAQLRLALEAAKIGCWSRDLASDHDLWTPETEVLLGYAPGTPRRPFLDWARRVHPDDLVRMLPQGHDVEIQGGRIESEYRIVLPDGREREMYSCGKSLDYPNGSRHIVGVIMDITERKQNERELALAKETAEALGRSKDSFFASMSHEIRTPMNGVLGLAQELLETLPLSIYQRELLETLLGCGNDLMTLLDDLLDFSRLDSGGFEPENVPFELTACIRTTQLAVSHRAAHKRLELAIQIDPNVPDWVNGDRLRLRQVLFNLLVNAIKFTEVGSVLLDVALEPSSNFIRFSIQDTGIGIAQERLKSLFEPFHQADPSIARRYGGTGLGLAICKRLTQVMGGMIAVESSLGQGSCFWFTLPLQAATPVCEIAIDQYSQEPPLEVETSGLEILLVEDNPVNRMVALKQLEKLGCKAKVATNGRDAVEQVASNRFDLVLMDIRMPIMDGMEASRTIRANPQIHQPMIVALTASVTYPERQTYFAAGIDICLAKPLQRELLSQVIRSLTLSKLG